MKAVERRQGAGESKNNPPPEIQKAVREIPIEKEKGSFSDVLADLEQILKDAKGGKRELPSLRSAAFEAAKRHGLGRDATYNRLVITTARDEFGTTVRTRTETLHDEWMALQVERGQYYGGKRGPKPRAANKDRPDAGQETRISRPNATIKFKDRVWTRDELFGMFSSDTGSMVWFNLRLNEDERKRLVRWLDANFTSEERSHFHPDLIDKANKIYGMHWDRPIRETASVRRENARGKHEKAYPFKSEWDEEE